MDLNTLPPPAGSPVQTPAETPKKKRHWVVRLVVIAVAIAILRAIFSGGSSTPASQTAAPSPAPTASAPAAAPAAKTAAPAPAPAPAAPVTVATFSGDGTVDTRPFTVGDGWELRWTYNGSGSEYGNVFTARTDPYNVSVMTEKVGPGSSYAKKGGTYSLHVGAVGGWTVEVVDVP